MQVLGVKTVLSRFRRTIEIDARSLAVFRVSLALILLFDLSIRIQDLRAHYTDSGTLPRIAILHHWWEPGNFSIHMISGEWIYQFALFLIAAISAVALLLGFKTRFNTFLSWLLLISLHTRAPIVLQGGDVLLRCLMFFANFLPMGVCYSIDSALSHDQPIERETKSNPLVIVSAGGAGLLLQVVLMYFFTVMLKTGKEWLPDGTAVEYSIYIEQFIKPFGVWLRQFPTFLRLMTYSVWYFELIGPILLFMPVGFLLFRSAAIFGFWSLHFGLFNSMELGIFPFISSAAMIPFVPTEYWTWLEKKFSPHKINNALLSFASFAGLARYKSLHPPNCRPGIVNNALAMFFTVFVILWNSATVERWGLHFPPALEWVGNAVRLDQLWNMFAPYPLRDDGWYVVPGTLVNGKEVDVTRHREMPVSWTKPESVASTYRDDRWRSYLMMLWKTDYEEFRYYYAQYLCHLWNDQREPDKFLASISVYFMRSDILLHGQRRKPVPVLLWQQDCFEGSTGPAPIPAPPTKVQYSVDLSR